VSAWEQFDAGFADVADNIRAALSGNREADLKAKRQQGLAAYVAAHERRDEASRAHRGAVVASFWAAIVPEELDDL